MIDQSSKLGKKSFQLLRLLLEKGELRFKDRDIGGAIECGIFTLLQDSIEGGIQEGNLVKIIERLMDDGFIHKNGRRSGRKFYGITPLGVYVLRENGYKLEDEIENGFVNIERAHLDSTGIDLTKEQAIELLMALLNPESKEALNEWYEKYWPEALEEFDALALRERELVGELEQAKF